jgi:hypothetical protein
VKAKDASKRVSSRSKVKVSDFSNRGFTQKASKSKNRAASGFNPDGFLVYLAKKQSENTFSLVNRSDITEVNKCLIVYFWSYKLNVG